MAGPVCGKRMGENSVISIVPQGEKSFTVLDAGIPLGMIAVSQNPNHAKNLYLRLSLEKYDAATADGLFRQLRKTLGRPLQVMLDSCDAEKADYLLAGGFKKLRRCYEVRVSSSNLKRTVYDRVPLGQAIQGSTEYQHCCEMLYHSYAKTHEAINPLTAELLEFCCCLPENAVFCRKGGRLAHWAFLEENEIAYVGSDEPRDFPIFAETLLSRMLAKYENIFFECDDCDPTAMELMSFFDLSNVPYCDTYRME